ncbi:MAG TPA: D-ribose pyranase [Polyangiaceae bacterium]|nr:D-ribose pyranase [Polyangiaceae bacterium]
MKKTGILNSGISKLVSEVGHTDQIVICDAGFPIPAHVPRIDLALTPGHPSFISVLEAVLIELEIEKVFYAEEIKQKNPGVLGAMTAVLGQVETKTVSHDQFKRLALGAKAAIRTGECSPYASVLLQAGVTF